MIILCVLIVANITAQETNKTYELTSEFKTITSEKGEAITLESGMLSVPEARNSDENRTISIAYYRLTSQSKTKRAPIFILAGGPGSSYLNSIHKENFFNEVTFYSNFTDVILFDQRGVGNSVPNLMCDEKKRIPLQDELTINNLKEVLSKFAAECQDYWVNQGVNLSAYNTDESASDINDLRKALGYEKIMLVGGSYGSHLGLHTIRKFPKTIEKAMFHGIEGPDHTWDIPSQTLNTLKRIAETIEASSYYEGKIPEGGLINALQSVIKKVEENPQLVTLSKGDQTLDVIVNEMIVKRVATYKAGRRGDPLLWPDLILDMYNGDFTFPAKAAVGMHRISGLNAMKFAMDFSSGISDKRKLKIKNDNATKVLGNINSDYTMQEETWKVSDLGKSFRTNIKTDIPILIIHGNWDTSTPIENAYDIMPTLTNGRLIEVETGTHNVLYECYRLVPDFSKMIANYITGNQVNFPKTIKLPKIQFPQVVSQAQESLWDACKSGDVEKVKLAISEGANVNALDTRASRSGRNPLNWAAYYGHAAIVELLIANKADVNGQNLTGFTALHHAVENNKLEMVQLLLSLGAEINKENKRGKKPIDIAIHNNNNTIIKVLKDH